MFFDGATKDDFSDETLIAMNPADIDDKDLWDEKKLIYKSASQRNQIALQELIFPLYFYDFETFMHPFSQYFYNQLHLPDYDYIRMADELVAYRCSSRKALDMIFNTDLQLNVHVPITGKSKTAQLLNFCEFLFISLQAK